MTIACLLSVVPASDATPRWRAATFARRTAAGLAAVALALVVAACGGGGSEDATEVAVPAAAAASATIGAAGGTLEGPDGVRVEIPAGALSADTVITVRRSGAGAPPLPAGAASSPTPLAVYELTPHGQTFAVPVTLSMPSPVAPNGPAVFMAEPESAWELVQGEPAGGRVAWTTLHFSWLFAYPCSASFPPDTPQDQRVLVCPWASSSAQATAVPTSAMAAIGLQRFRVAAAADVTVRFSVATPLGCTVPLVTVRRSTFPPSGATQVTTSGVVLLRQPVAIPNADDRLAGSIDVPLRFEFADNGTRVLALSFSCDGGPTVGGSLVFEVAVPAPPVPVAPPVIAQQPADASVLAGATATFDVLATAADRLVVRWERKAPSATAFTAASGDVPIAGGSRLAFAAPIGDDGTQVRAMVCNVRGGVDACIASRVATLGVVSPAPTPSSTRLSGRRETPCAIGVGGNVLCWGGNTQGQLGRGSAVTADGTPVAVGGLVGVTSIGSDFTTGCATHGGGRLSCWGAFLGDGRFEQSAAPVAIAGVTDAALVRVVNGLFCWVTTGKRAHCRDGNGANGASPLQMDGAIVEDVLDVAFAAGGRCVLLGSGVARCAEYDIAAPGLPLVTVRRTPATRALDSGAGFPVSCLALQSGEVRCRGRNTNGQLGSTDTALLEATVPGIATAVAVSSGWRQACALLADGSVSCWGSGFMGNGGGDESMQPPRPVVGLSGVVEISVGFDVACALRNDGRVLCWGDNARGAVGQGTTTGVARVPTATVAGAVFAR